MRSDVRFVALVPERTVTPLESSTFRSDIPPMFSIVTLVVLPAARLDIIIVSPGRLIELMGKNLNDNSQILTTHFYFELVK